MTRTEKLQKALNGLWTAQDVKDVYRVTTMTVHNWRLAGLPALELKGAKRDAIRFVPSDVKKWYRRNRELDVTSMAG